MQQIAHILEQPFSLQTSHRKTRKRPPYNLVLFIPLGAGTVPACTREKNKLQILTSLIFPTQYVHIRFFLFVPSFFDFGPPLFPFRPPLFLISSEFIHVRIHTFQKKLTFIPK